MIWKVMIRASLEIKTMGNLNMEIKNDNKFFFDLRQYFLGTWQNCQGSWCHKASWTFLGKIPEKGKMLTKLIFLHVHIQLCFYAYMWSYSFMVALICALRWPINVAVCLRSLCLFDGSVELCGISSLLYLAVGIIIVNACNEIPFVRTLQKILRSVDT